jgi:hypothetical protein
VLKYLHEESTPVVHSSEVDPSSSKERSKSKKLRAMVRGLFSVCRYTTTQVYETRKGVNKLLNHAGFAAPAPIPPPSFFVDSTTSEEEEHQDMPEDDEPFIARMRSTKGPKIGTRKTLNSKIPNPHGKDATSNSKTKEDDTVVHVSNTETGWSKDE